MPDNAEIACSYDGTRLYMIGAAGTLHVFDTDTLKELRRVQVDKRKDDANSAWATAYSLWVTKHGPLVREQSGPWYKLYDRESLDGIRKFRQELEAGMDGEFAVAPDSDAVAYLSKVGDLQICRLLDGKLIERVTKRQLAKPNDNSSSRKWIRDVTISEDGTVLRCQYGFRSDFSQHAFKLSKEGITHLDVNPEPSDGERVVGLDRGECSAVSRQGLVYLREELPDQRYDRLIVLDQNGREVLRDPLFDDKREAKIVPLPHRPERVFVLRSDELRVADLGGDDE